MVNKVVGSMSEWSGVLKEFFRQLDGGEFTKDQLQAFLEHRDPFEQRKVQEVAPQEKAEAGLPPTVPNIDVAAAYKALGMKAEYAEWVAKHPEQDNPKLWVLPMLTGLTCNKVVAGLRKAGVDMSLHDEDLDAVVTKNDRDLANGSYSVAFARNVEADEEFKNLSANQLKKRKHQGITLLERLLLELAYFLKNGQHLDEANWTLCTGSRNRFGDVPVVGWGSGSRGVRVSWCDAGCHDSDFRSRSVVSCQQSAA